MGKHYEVFSERVTSKIRSINHKEKVSEKMAWVKNKSNTIVMQIRHFIFLSIFKKLEERMYQHIFTNPACTWVDKFFSRPPIFRTCNFTCALDRAHKKWVIKSVSLIDTELETLLFVLHQLNRTCSFHLKCVPSIPSISAMSLL